MLFGACRNEGNHFQTTKDHQTYLQEHNLQKYNTISLHQALWIISMASKMAEADEGPLISQSNAVGSRKKWTSVTFPSRSWRHVFYS